MSISIQNVSKIFGEQKALSDVSLEVPAAQVLGLLGPNGAGKSTLMRLVSGFYPATSGSVAVCGFDVLEHPMKARSCVGYLPEHNPIHKDMYVREYLEYAAGMHGIKHVRAAVEVMIKKVGLTSEAHKLIDQLSKGYRQRVGLAQALIHDPKVLILDEPTSGLDPIQLVDIRKLIREVGKERTVILSTHIMQEVEEVCDRVVLIHEGKVAADDTLEAFANRPGGLESAFHELEAKS
jgi:ABC-2 type transport system ATP-binding protein